MGSAYSLISLSRVLSERRNKKGVSSELSGCSGWRKQAEIRKKQMSKLED
jgi:hypothetical protein